MKLPRYSGLHVYAYGPLTASCSAFRMCPADHALIKRPSSTITDADRECDAIGAGKYRKMTADKNPSGRGFRCNVRLSINV